MQYTHMHIKDTFCIITKEASSLVFIASIRRHISPIEVRLVIVRLTVEWV